MNMGNLVFRHLRWVVIVMLGAISACGGDTSRDPILGATGNASLAPSVISVSPTDGATVVKAEVTSVAVTFNEAMAEFAGTGSFTVTCAAPCATPAGTVVVSGTTATFSLAAGTTFLPGTLYTVTVTGAKSAGTGLSIENPFVSRFTTGTAPTVTSVIPANAATNVGVSTTTVQVTFSEAVALAATTPFTLTCAAPCTNPVGSVALSANKTVATFTLEDGTSFQRDATYTATVANAISLASGFTQASPFVSQFTMAAAPTVTSVLPVNGAAGLGIASTTVQVTFNEAVTLPGASPFTVTCVAPCVNPVGSVALNTESTIATYTLNAGTSFQANTTYTVTVTNATSVSDGFAMEAPFVSTFTMASAPSVATVLPLDFATDVVVTNPLISATFDAAVVAVTGANFTLTCVAPCTNPTGLVALDSAGTTATFTLANTTTLEPNTIYTATITGITGALSGYALQTPFTWTFKSQPRPRVTAVAPVNDATGVPINNTIINAAFTEAMSPLTGAASFTLTCATCVVTAPAGSVSLDAATSKIATFALNTGVSFEQGKVYTATVTAAQSLSSGLTLAAPFSWTFTTGSTLDVTRPRVDSTVPLTSTPGPTLNVPVNTVVAVVFTEDMNPATITTAGTFSLTCVAPCTSPTGNVTYVVGSRTATFSPNPLADLEADVTYTATVSAAAEDLAGNSLAGNTALLPLASAYVWTFTTAAAVPVPAANIDVLSVVPLNAATGVCPSATVNATFTVPSGFQMDPASIDALTFTLAETLVPANTVTASSVVLVGATDVATFTPQNALVDGTQYTATIKSGENGVKDLAIPANTMGNEFSWSFTVGPATGACLAPVPLNSAATFGVIGGNAGMTNQGVSTIINGDIGTTAASTLVTGFHDAGPGCTYTEVAATNIGTVNGLIYTAAPPPTVDCPSEGTSITAGIANQALLDAQTAYNTLAGLPLNLAPNDNLSGLTLAPGVYTSNGGSFLIQNGTIDAAGDLTLDAQGNPDAVWVFQMATSLTVGGPGAAFPRSIVLINQAKAKNVFWQVGSAATINAAGGGTMVGTIISMAATEISTPGNVDIVTLNGRALALTASVTMVNTIINVPAP